MSGSGGGGDWRSTGIGGSVEESPGEGVGNGAGGGAPSNECDVTEVTYLNSPNRDVISWLRPGDILNLVLEEGPPQRLLAMSHNSEVAGSVTSPKMTQLILCIRQGQEYTAEILAIRGARCQIRIGVA